MSGKSLIKTQENGLQPVSWLSSSEKNLRVCMRYHGKSKNDYKIRYLHYIKQRTTKIIIIVRGGSKWVPKTDLTKREM